MVNCQQSFGKVHFASLRKLFDTLAEGKNVPKQEYKYRIESTKLITAISFIQNCLSMRPGIL